jgi:hypothetical protein
MHVQRSLTLQHTLMNSRARSQPEKSRHREDSLKVPSAASSSWREGVVLQWLKEAFHVLQY